MKRFLMSTVAAGMALSLFGAPLAMAEQNQGGPPPAQHMAGHAPAPHATQHTAVQHTEMRPATEPGATHSPAQHSTLSHPVLNTSMGTHGAPQQHDMQHQPMPHESMGGGHSWHSGDRYNGSRNYVRNWNEYHLHRPPQGYEWVQDGSEFVLIAVATGVITDVILSSTDQ